MSRPKDTRTRVEKFHQSYTVTNAGCWEFKPDHTGYGRFYYDYTTDRAHRASWEIHNGAIPEGMLVRHKCDNPPCANPEHLELGTEADNAKDAVKRRRTLTGERNTFAKLTDQAVIDIRAAIQAGDTVKDVAARYGCTVRNVRNVANRVTWKHV